MDCSLPGSSAHGIFQARVLEWVAIAFSAVTEFFKFAFSHLHDFENCLMCLLAIHISSLIKYLLKIFFK